MKKRRPQRRQPPQQRESLPPETNPELARAVLEMVDTQLQHGTPPEARQTFERLVRDGYTPEGARQLLAHVVIREIFSVMSRGERYDEARYIAALSRLPALPDTGDES